MLDPVRMKSWPEVQHVLSSRRVTITYPVAINLLLHSNLPRLGQIVALTAFMSAGAMYDPHDVTDGAKKVGLNLLTSPVYRDWLLAAIANADADSDDDGGIDDVTIDTVRASEVVRSRMFGRVHNCI